MLPDFCCRFPCHFPAAASAFFLLARLLFPSATCLFLPANLCLTLFFFYARFPEKPRLLYPNFPGPQHLFSDLTRPFRSFFPCKTNSSCPSFPRTPSAISYADFPAFFTDYLQNLAASHPVFPFPTRPFSCFLFPFLPVLPALFFPALLFNLSKKTYPLLCLLLPGRAYFQLLPAHLSS
ncbi:hypothetical protein QMK33_21300 [Hymenobacter sp. H14-R3]|uniref:hypothetical protein n=1 Tax=Hymenobacter sp. H14-R3 TaxID=3046308 RepID=UPI0024BAE179|nr:hypothetical protein [Hymenobacter sp. H14-R3]MDJ0367690.1 hypothetical protein [Hymenobacter sp. H14-R3]